MQALKRKLRKLKRTERKFQRDIINGNGKNYGQTDLL